MTKRAPSRVPRPLAMRSGARALPALVALALVLLQLATALHFALIPHAFNAGLSGFEHVHRVLVSRVTERAPERPSVVTGSPTCAPEACPIGFSGPVSLRVAEAALTASVALPVGVSSFVTVEPVARCRAQLLLAAPKTSPPRAA